MTARRPRALLLTHRFPYPPDKGDKIRSWHLLKFLATRYDVALGTFVDDPEDFAHRDVVESVCVRSLLQPLSPWAGRVRALTGLLRGEPLSFAWYRDPKMSAFVAEERKQGLDVEIYFSGAMTVYQKGATAPVFIDLVDADSAKWESYAEDGAIWSRMIHGREARKVAEAEAAAADSAAMAFLISAEEKAVLTARGVPDKHVDWYRNGIDLEMWRPDGDFAPLEAPFDLVFTGAMDYRPNAEAVVGFTQDVWPALRQRYPDLTFAIVGRNPLPSVEALGSQDGITVTGRVDDVRPYLAGAKVAVAPLAIARGVQNKVLEAMAMAVPIVASAGAIAGTAAVPGQHLIEANEPEEMLAAVCHLLDDSAAAQALGAAGRGLMESDYAWDQVFERFARHLPQDD